jgi:hypothetical protein
MRWLQQQLLRLGVTLRLLVGVGGVAVLVIPVTVTRGVPVQVLDQDGVRTLVLQVVVAGVQTRALDQAAVAGVRRTRVQQVVALDGAQVQVLVLVAELRGARIPARLLEVTGAQMQVLEQVVDRLGVLLVRLQAGAVLNNSQMVGMCRSARCILFYIYS